MLVSTQGLDPEAQASPGARAGKKVADFAADSVAAQGGLRVAKEVGPCIVASKGAAEDYAAVEPSSLAVWDKILSLVIFNFWRQCCGCERNLSFLVFDPALL